VQDLHGYDHPWPAGGGKNLFDITNVFDGSDYTFTNGTGTISRPYTTGGRVIQYTDGISIPSGSTVTISADVMLTQDGSDTYKLVSIGLKDNAGTGGYTRNDVIMNAFNTWQRISSTVTAPSNTNWVAIQPRAEGHTLYFKNIQIELASTATDYAPYSNICPITGWTGAKMMRTGKNLLSQKKYQHSSTIVRMGGEMANEAYITLKAGTYTLSVQANVSVTCYYILANQVIKTIGVNGGTFTLSEESKLIIYCYKMGGLNIDDVISWQLELGSTATDYEPYQGQTYDITFPTEAGTVYGGSLDVTNGVLTVDRAMVDLGTLNWNRLTASSTGKVYFQLSSELTSMKKSSGNTIVQPIKCSHYTSETWSNVLDKNGYDRSIACGWVDKSYIIIYDSSKTTMSNAEFKTAMSGIQLCYELATSLTYHLTP